jgi:hypothetical protein
LTDRRQRWVRRDVRFERLTLRWRQRIGRHLGRDSGACQQQQAENRQ